MFVNTPDTNSAEVLLKMLDSSPVRVSFLGPDLTIRFANQAYRESHPEVRGTVIGKHIRELYDADFFESYVDHFIEAASGNRQEFSVSQKEDGATSVFRTELVPNLAADGTPDGIFVYCTVLTKSKKQRHRADWNFDLALKSHLIAFWELDPSRDGWIFAEHIEGLLGLSEGDLDNSIECLLRRVHPEDRGHVLYDCGAVELQGASYVNEFRCRTATGEYRWFRLIGNRELNNDGETSSLAGTIADINDLKNAEILAADRLKYRDSFLSMLSHELRNPVAGIQYAIDIFGDHSDMSETLSPQFRTSVGIIRRQTTVISRLLNDLLNVSRVSQNQILFEEETICYAELLNEVVESAESIYAKKNQSLKFSCDTKKATIRGDRVRLTQAFMNLIDNACKFSAHDSAIKIGCAIVGDMVVTSVCDSGQGIAPDSVGNVFDLFFQEEQPLDRKAGGLGVGLYLVKKIVDAHRGTVSVVSPGEIGGCEFEIRLPIESTNVSDSAPLPKKSEDSLVLVENNEDSRLALSMALQSRGFDVTTFEDGQSAVDNIPRLAPKIVLVDIGLPGKDGIEVIRALRHAESLNDTFFVALTGYGQKHEREMILSAGFDNHLVKPVDIAELCSIINGRSIA